MVDMKRWLVVGLLLLLVSVPALAANPPYWHDVRSIARASISVSYFASLGKAPGNPFDSLLVVYFGSGFGISPGVSQLKRSPNAGVTFSESLEVMNSNFNFNDAGRTTAVAHDAHGIHVVVSAFTAGVDTGVFYLRSTDGGSTWSTPHRVDTTCYGMFGSNAAIALDSYGFTVFWINGCGGLALYCRHYTYAGGWNNIVRVDNSGQSCAAPQALAIQYLGNGGAPISTLYVVYSRYNGSNWVPACMYSYDFGQTWNYASIPQPTDFKNGAISTPEPSLTGRDGVNNVYVAYCGQRTNDGGYRVFCSKVGGASFARLTKGDSTSNFNQQVPRITIGPGDTLHAVWADDRAHSGWPEIYYDRSSDGGQTWLEDPTNHLNRLISRNLNQSPYSCSQPDIIADGINQVVVWDSTTSSLMYRKRSLDTKAPSPPTGLQVVWLNVVELYWTGVSDAAGYNVYRAPGVMPPFAFQKITPQPVIGTVYYDYSASPTGCYTYYVTAVDAAENESGSSNYAQYFGCSIGAPIASVDVGNPTPSPNTVHRAGYYTWGSTSDSTVDYDPDSLVYRFTGLAPDSFYLLGVEYFENSPSHVRVQSLNIDGVQVHGASLLPGRPSKMVYLVPKRTYQDSTIEVSFVRNQGPDAVVAQLWLYQAHFPGGGPQSAGVVDLKGAKALLYDPAPNPSSGSVDIAYALAASGRVSLVVYNIAGQRVRSLVNREQSPGKYSLSWDSRDDLGKRVPGGVYFFRLNLGNDVFSKRITLLR